MRRSFQLIVESLTVISPPLWIAPPVLLAELPLKVQPVSVAVPSFSTPPPLPVVAPSLIVRPESVAMTPPLDVEHADRPAAAYRHQSGPRSVDHLRASRLGEHQGGIEGDRLRRRRKPMGRT